MNNLKEYRYKIICNIGSIEEIENEFFSIYFKNRNVDMTNEIIKFEDVWYMHVNLGKNH